MLLAALWLGLAPLALAVVPPAAPRSAAAAPAALGPLPAGWPSTLQLGMSDGPGGAAALKASANFGFRYQYLAGGVNTGNGWATWNTDAQFVTYYVQDSVQHHVTPVFTYYMLLQSTPGNTLPEPDADFTNLQNVATMTAYYNDLKLFFQRAGAFAGTRVVLHVEPDLWGYMQQRAVADNATTVPAQVAATGLPELAGLPNDLTGFARAVIRLRDAHAPNVQLGYHVSVWGTRVDILYSKPPDAEVIALGARAAAFYQSLQAPFDLLFAEFSDRDAAFKQYVYGDGGRSWWAAADYARNVLFLSTIAAATQKRLVMWQIPLGNTRMRALNNTWNHYQDNVVEWLLDDASRAHLTAYAQAGVIAFLFGRGADGATCACDAANDGVTNPAPINGNSATSLSADDDGGFFRQKAREYYTAGALPLTTGLPTCVPRPSVRVTTARTGAGRLQVTIAAGTSTGAPTNQLQSLQFGAASGALLDVGSHVGATGNLTVTLPPNTQHTTFTVRQAAAGQAATVPLTVVDACGAWPTFVGGGAAAFAGSGDPAPTALPAPAAPTPSAPSLPAGPSTPPPSCAPRPSVRVTTAPAGPDRLQVAVAAGAAGVELRALRFGAASGAAIDAGPPQPPNSGGSERPPQPPNSGGSERPPQPPNSGGSQTSATGSFTVALPSGTSQTSFVVRRAVSGQAATVPLVVVDSCGEWPTVVGGGAGAW
jgi:hypothetical protein